MRTWSRDGIRSLGNPNSTKTLCACDFSPNPSQFLLFLQYSQEFCSLERKAQAQLFVLPLQDGIPQVEGGGICVSWRIWNEAVESNKSPQGYLSSSLHSLVDFLQEIPLPAAFGVPDGGGVGGFCDQQVRAAFIDPGSSGEREFQPKIPSDPPKIPAGNHSWHFSSRAGSGDVVVLIGNGNKESLGNCLAALIKLIQLQIGVTDLESNISPVCYPIKIFTALKYSPGQQGCHKSLIYASENKKMRDL